VSDASTCWRCGADSPLGSQFCSACGQDLRATPAVPAAQPAQVSAGFWPPLSPGGPPSMFPPAPAHFAVTGFSGSGGLPGAVSGASAGAGAPAGTAGTPGIAAGEPRPFSVLVLSLMIAGASVIGALLAWEYFRWANWRFSYDEVAWGLVDGAFAAAYAITAVYGLMITPRLWNYQPFAWKTANQLTAAWLGLDLLAIVIWTGDTKSFVGGALLVGMLFGLNLTSVRALYGRGTPTTPGPQG
jgi:hypothetical protein